MSVKFGMKGRGSDRLAACWAGVSQPSSLSLNQAVAAQRAATAFTK